VGKSFELRAALYDKFYQNPEFFTIISECPKQLLREIDVVLFPCINAWGFPHECLGFLLKYVVPDYKLRTQAFGAVLQKTGGNTS
jgi:hypothetical protein